MESESQVPPNYRQNLAHPNPHPDHVDSSVAMADEGEGGHHPHKSVLKKVKDKAKKIKDTIKKHGHDHDHEGGVHQEAGYVEEDDDDEDEETVVDPELHGAPTYDSTVIRTTATESDVNVEHPKHKLGPVAENKIIDDDEEDDVVEAAAPKIKIGARVEDPHSAPVPSNYQSNKVVDDGGKEANNVVSEFENLKIDKKTESSEHVSVKGYLAEKLRPGEEDKALSEVITGVLTTSKKKKKKEISRAVVEGSRVKESEEVKARLGAAPEKKREGEDALAAGKESSSGQGVVERLKEAVGGWLGKGTGLQTAQDSIDGTYLSDPISATKQEVKKGEEASGRPSA